MKGLEKKSPNPVTQSITNLKVCQYYLNDKVNCTNKKEGKLEHKQRQIESDSNKIAMCLFCFACSQITETYFRKDKWKHWAFCWFQK